MSRGVMCYLFLVVHVSTCITQVVLLHMHPSKRQLVPALQAVLGIPGEFGFLKKNELFVGRVAMLGFAAELVGEVCALLLLRHCLVAV